MTLAPGEPVPDLVAPNQHGEPTTVDTDGPTVLYCYPEDGTPGCSTEADQFAAEYDTYCAAGVSVYGLSVDPVASHREFADARDVPFDLLADPDGHPREVFVDLLDEGVVEAPW